MTKIPDFASEIYGRLGKVSNSKASANVGKTRNSKHMKKFVSFIFIKEQLCFKLIYKHKNLINKNRYYKILNKLNVAYIDVHTGCVYRVPNTSLRASALFCKYLTLFQNIANMGRGPRFSKRMYHTKLMNFSKNTKFCKKRVLTHTRSILHSYRNQSIDLQCKPLTGFYMSVALT